MDIYQSLFSDVAIFNELIAQDVFEAVPEDGPIMIIMDPAGNTLLSDPEGFASLNISESSLMELCTRVDDGVEPAIAQLQQCSVIASQLAGEHGSYGYIFLVIPQYNHESTLVINNLIEMLLNQIGLIVRLYEKNRQLYENRLKYYHSLENYQTSSN
jgi:hypothetical protein